MMMVASRANVEHKVDGCGGADERQSVEARDARILINLVPLAALPLFVIVPDKQVFFSVSCRHAIALNRLLHVSR